MCKIVLIVNKNKKNTNKINKILRANTEVLLQEKDGYAILRDGKVDYHYPTSTYDFRKKLSYKTNFPRFRKNITYKGEKVYCLHVRTATGGEKGINGLHLQNINGWYFAHNGWVRAYQGVRIKNDSYFFFRNLIKKYGDNIEQGVLEEEAERRGFYGRGVLIKDKKIIIFSTQDIFVYGLPDCLIFTSFKLNLIDEDRKKKHLKILGLDFWADRRIKGVEEHEGGAFYIEIEGLKVKKHLFFEVPNRNFIFYNDDALQESLKFFSYNPYENLYEL